MLSNLEFSHKHFYNFSCFGSACHTQICWSPIRRNKCCVTFWGLLMTKNDHCLKFTHSNVWLSIILLLSFSWYKLHILSSTVTYLLTHLLMNKHCYNCKERCHQPCQEIASSYTLKKGLFLLRQHDPLLMHKILSEVGYFLLPLLQFTNTFTGTNS